MIDTMPIGYISSINDNVRRYFDKKWSVVVLSLNFNHYATILQTPIKYVIPSKYPEITMDFNFLVDSNIPFCEVEKHIQSYKNPILLSYKFVEVYSGKQIEKGKKCLTFSFTIGSQSKTLTNDEKEEFSTAIINHMSRQGYVLRQ